MNLSFLKQKLSNSPFFIALISIFLGILLTFFIWESIKFPFVNIDNTVGKLSLNNFNPLNNLIRFILFVSLPSLFFYFFLKVKKLELPLIKKELKFEKILISLFLIIIGVNTFIFFNQDFNTQNFDYFHEGLEILPALNFQSYGGIWSSTLFVRGAFIDLFTAYLGWEIFNTSIGAYRYIVSVNNLLVEISFVFLIYSIWVNIKKYQFGNFFPAAAFIFYLTTSSIQNLDRRQLIFIFGLSLVFLALKYSSKIIYFLAGFLSSISIFFSLDTGIFYNLVLILFFILIFIYSNQKKKNLLFGILGIFLSWLCLIYLIGYSEFRSFLENLFFLLKYKDLLDSYIYPNPFQLENFRSTFPLILIMLNLKALVFTYKKNYFDNKKEIFIVHSILTFASIIQYRSGLGRSDLLHIEYSSTFIILLFSFNICILSSFLKFIQNYFIKITNTLLILLVFLLIYQLYINFNPNNLLNYHSNLDKFVNLPDKEFTINDKFNALNELEEIFENEKCIFSFGNDAITPFLLRKPSCSEFYLSYFASPQPFQEKLVEMLVKKSPEYIIYSTYSWYQNIDNISNEKRLNKVMRYIDSNYIYYKTVSNNWVIYKKVIRSK